MKYSIYNFNYDTVERFGLHNYMAKTGIISYAIKIKHSAPRISRLAGQIGVLKKKTVKSVLRLNNYSWLSAHKIIVLIC